MTGGDVGNVHAVLVAAGLDYWITGGWGVDALLGTQTREHADLDISVPADSLPAVLEALTTLGLAPTTDWLPTRIAVSDAAGREVDVHPIVFATDGSAWLPGLNGERYRYPADSFVSGLVDGTVVPCISADLQAVFHSGYQPQVKDIADMEALQSAGLVRGWAGNRTES